jgi:hypothetical protein
MLSEIDTICPVQFIEGRNKSAEPAQASDVSPSAYIEYVPRVSYSIARIDIFIDWTAEVKESQNNRFVIYADYLDHPSDIIFTEGNMRIEVGDYLTHKNWRTVDITKPVVFIAHKKYWLQFCDCETKFAFYAGSKGDQIVTKSKLVEEWETKSDILMLRFYGRVLPLALVH